MSAVILKIYQNDLKYPKLLISYKRDKEGNLPKERVRFWISADGSKRFDDKFPIVFIRSDLINDYEALTMANNFYFKIHEYKQVNTEKELIMLYQFMAYEKQWKDFQRMPLKWDNKQQDYLTKPSLLIKGAKYEPYTPDLLHLAVNGISLSD